MKRLALLLLLQTIYLLKLSQALPHYLQDPFENAHHAEAEELLYDTTQRWMSAQSVTSSCSSCISALQLVKSLSYTSESLLVRTLTNVCKRSKRMSPEVVSGILGLSSGKPFCICML
jgi:sphingomyelin phosphodiesterase